MQQTRPEIKFLFLTEPYLSADKLALALHTSDGKSVAKEVQSLANLTIRSKPLNLDSVYDDSLIMLLPDLEQNRSLEPVINALVNGVPVITTDYGKDGEATSTKDKDSDKIPLSQGVVRLPVPASTLKDATCLPSDEEIQPYVEAILHLWSQNHADNRKIALNAYDLNRVQNKWQLFFAQYLHQHSV